MDSNFLHLYDEIKNVAKPLSTSSEQQSENLAQIPTRSETGRILFPRFTRVLLFDSFERDGRGEDCAVAEFRGGYGVGRARERSGGDGYLVESRREGDCELRRGEDWE